MYISKMNVTNKKKQPNKLINLIRLSCTSPHSRIKKCSSDSPHQSQFVNFQVNHRQTRVQFCIFHQIHKVIHPQYIKPNALLTNTNFCPISKNHRTWALASKALLYKIEFHRTRPGEPVFLISFRTHELLVMPFVSANVIKL